MAASASILLVFDVSALIPGKTREWQEFAQVGQCVLPQAVSEEMQFLCDRATEPDIETTAREFSRFYPNSGWQVTTANASHPKLQPASGQTLSKKARRALAVAQTAYGLTQEQPNALVVLVANNQPLLKSMQGLGVETLGGLTTALLRQWSRSGQPPAAIAKQLQVAKSRPATSSVASPNSSVRPNSAMHPTMGGNGKVPPALSRASVKTKTKPRSGHPGAFSQMISGLLALVFFLGGSLLLWRFIQPASFNQVWQQLGLPGAKSQQK